MKEPLYVCGNYRYDFTSKRSIGGYIKEHIIFQIAQIIQLVSLTISTRLNGINLLKCVLKRGRNERK
jgi:hypothetical protein